MSTTSQAPNLDGPVQTCRGKGVGILRVDGQAHYVVAVTLKRLNALPVLLPVPELNRHIITSGQDEWLCRVDDNGTNVVGVGLESGNLLGGVVVVDPNLEVIGANDEPVLAGDEATSSYRDIGNFKGLYN